jgi:hypothetical protein
MSEHQIVAYRSVGSGFDGPGKGSLKMKTKLFFSLLLLTAAVAPGALAAADGRQESSHRKGSIARHAG